MEVEQERHAYQMNEEKEEMSKVEGKEYAAPSSNIDKERAAVEEYLKQKPTETQIAETVQTLRPKYQGDNKEIVGDSKQIERFHKGVLKHSKEQDTETAKRAETVAGLFGAVHPEKTSEGS